MSDQKKPSGEQAEQELSGEQLEQVNGGILIGLNQPTALPAVQKVREAAALGDGSVRPVGAVSLNFSKK